MAVAVLLVAAVTSCGGSGDPRRGEAVSAGGAERPDLVVRSQTTDGGSILLDSLTVPAQGGFVVLYADGAGAPGEQLAVSEALTQRDAAEDVEITLNGDVRTDGKVWIVVHTDRDLDRAFDPAVDEAVEAGGGSVAAPIELGDS